jgi:hypothetical protein
VQYGVKIGSVGIGGRGRVDDDEDNPHEQCGRLAVGHLANISDEDDDGSPDTLENGTDNDISCSAEILVNGTGHVIPHEGKQESSAEREAHMKQLYRELVRQEWYFIEREAHFQNALVAVRCYQDRYSIHHFIRPWFLLRPMIYYYFIKI